MSTMRSLQPQLQSFTTNLQTTGWPHVICQAAVSKLQHLDGGENTEEMDEDREKADQKRKTARTAAWYCTMCSRPGPYFSHKSEGTEHYIQSVPRSERKDLVLIYTSEDHNPE